MWKTKQDRPEINKKIFMLTDKGVSLRTFTDNIPFRILMNKCIKWAYVDEIVEMLNNKEV